MLTKRKVVYADNEGHESQRGLVARVVPLELVDDTLEFGVAFENAPTGVVAGTFAVAYWNDLGEQVRGQEVASAQRVSREGFDQTFYVQRGLPDGFYRIQVVTLASTQDSTQHTDESWVYLEVQEGTPVVVSAEHWRLNSRTLIAKTAPASSKGRGE